MSVSVEGKRCHFSGKKYCVFAFPKGSNLLLNPSQRTTPEQIFKQLDHEWLQNTLFGLLLGFGIPAFFLEMILQPTDERKTFSLFLSLSLSPFLFLSFSFSFSLCFSFCFSLSLYLCLSLSLSLFLSLSLSLFRSFSFSFSLLLFLVLFLVLGFFPVSLILLR